MRIDGINSGSSGILKPNSVIFQTKLGWNSHSRRLAILKHTVQQHLVHVVEPWPLCSSKHLFTPKENPLPISNQSPLPPPPAPGSSNLRSVSMDLSLLDISCKWNPITCDLLQLAPFIELHVFEVHLLCGMYQIFFFIAEECNNYWESELHTTPPYEV